MKEKIALDFRCVNRVCKKGNLDLDSILQVGDECIEGFLSCKLCNTQYPILEGVPLLVENFSKYASQRINTFGKWIVKCKSSGIKSYLKSEGLKIHGPTMSDRYEENSRWYESYLHFRQDFPLDDKLLPLLKKEIKPDNIYKMLTDENLSLDGIGLDIGCSIGSSTFELSKKLSYVFGIDLSFSFILEARKIMQSRKIYNIEFIVADATNLPFESHFFQSIVALNVIDRIDFYKLVSSVNGCIKKQGKLVLIDPYDFVDNNSKDKLDSIRIRQELESMGYNTEYGDSYIPWILRVNERCYLFYFVDLVVATKIN
ncbi:MAG TPA: class I SAM-dependent methyltransferase [Nitrososphaeraceae archaeon]|nr:class I SAM-dependent methyltransferase [Nitrososphaeraceae archaeon]